MPIAKNSGNDFFVRLASAASAHKSMLHKTKRHIVGTNKVKWSPPGHNANCSRFDSVNVSERDVGYRSGVPNRHSGVLIEGDEEEEIQSIERHLVIEKKKNELLRLKRENDSLVIDNVGVKVGNCVPNSVFNIDYRSLELENLRSNKSLVQRAEEQMGNLGLFAEKDQQSLASSQLDGGKINNKYSLPVNSEKLQSGADNVVSSSIKSKLIWPNSDCIQNCQIGEMCTVPNVGVEIESSAKRGSENILCRESHTVGDQNCFISKSCVAPMVGMDKESSSER